MRVLTLVEAVMALGVGALGGVGLLYGTGDLKTGGQVAQLRAEYDTAYQTELSKLETDRRLRLEADEAAARRRLEEAARAEAEAAAAAARAKVEAEAKARSVEESKLPAFGLLVLKAASELSVDFGGAQRGKSVELAFDEAPTGKIKVKGGKFTINLTPRVKGAKLVVDVSVSPMAIIAADGERKGVSTAQAIPVGKVLKLDFQSPAAGDLNLVLGYRR